MLAKHRFESYLAFILITLCFGKKTAILLGLHIVSRVARCRIDDVWVRSMVIDDKRSK